LKNQMNFKPYNILIKSKFMNLASAIITNSLELKNEVISDYAQASRKVFNIPFTTTINVTNRREINLDKMDHHIYVGCPGRIHPDKNQTLLIDVLAEMKDEGIILVFAGSENTDFLVNHTFYNKYEQQIIKLG